MGLEQLEFKKVEIKDPITIDYGDLWDILEENKRYREALEDILHLKNIMNNIDLRTFEIVEHIASKALEGKE